MTSSHATTFLYRCTALCSSSQSASLSLGVGSVVRSRSDGGTESSFFSTTALNRPSALHSSSMLYTAPQCSTQRRFASSEGNQAFGGTFNPYKILGVDPKTPPKDVKRAYQRLALRYHPDNGETGSSEKFQAVNEAYNEIKDGKVWRGGFGGGGGESGGGASGSGQRAGGAQGRGGFYTYEEPGSTTENYFADNRRLFTFGLLMMGWCFGFLLLRVALFIIFPLKGQAPKPPIQDVDENGVPIPPTMEDINVAGSSQTPSPSSSAAIMGRSPTAATSSPSAGVNSSVPFSSPPLGTNFNEQDRKEAFERQQSGLKHITGDMRSSSNSNIKSPTSTNANNSNRSDDFLSSDDGGAKVYSIDFASDEVKPEPKKKGWWGV